MGLLLGLHHNNVVQWDREDAARRDDADDHAVADAKRDIDVLNAKRHELVEAIDARACCRHRPIIVGAAHNGESGDGVRPIVGARAPHCVHGGCRDAENPSTTSCTRRACQCCTRSLRPCRRRWRRSSTTCGPAASGSCRIGASSCTGDPDRMKAIPAAIEAVEHLIAQGRRHARCRAKRRRSAALVVSRLPSFVSNRYSSPRRPMPHSAPADVHDGDAAVAPRQVLRETTAHDDAPVGGVECGEPPPPSASQS